MGDLEIDEGRKLLNKIIGIQEPTVSLEINISTEIDLLISDLGYLALVID